MCQYESTISLFTVRTTFDRTASTIATTRSPSSLAPRASGDCARAELVGRRFVAFFS
jgi:hypothetical protein